MRETAALVQLLAKKCGHAAPSIPTGNSPARPLTKRKRDADQQTVFLRQLMVIPSISESIAKKLVEHFGSLPALQEAVHGDRKKFPRIELGNQALGQARIHTD